ncbi:FAD binding domain-containing protein [Colletotrichum musicola]|uniref:FAD binding domain-containing protein n=1 Tax=Colletotrichum musicola TaxID=2175873 RepID=A0A8H6JIB4_9PEZI|nr:FAD binding domain-containing protein [Colletotrichum musicola]
MRRYCALLFLSFTSVPLVTALVNPEASRGPPNGANLRSILTAASNNWASGTAISFPGQDSFDNATERWATYRPPTYAASISPATEKDVATAVKLATSNRLSFLATGGRHGYNTDLASLQNGIAIDLSRLNQVRVDRQARTLTVGPGARFGNIVGPVSDAGFEIQTGTASCPSMIGVTIGGGIGRQMGTLGLVADALISARLVTADGKIVDVSANSNPELFWGIRGAGFNFGIITQATYKLQPNPTRTTYTSVDVIFPAPKNASYFRMLETVLANQPARLSVTSSIMYNSTSNQAQIAGSWVYNGPRDVALRVMAPMLALGPSVTSVSDVRWEDVSRTAAFGADAIGCVPGRNWNVYSANLRTFRASLGQTAFSRMDAFYRENPEARVSTILLEAFPNQAARAIPNSATAFPWRDTATFV